MVDKNSIDIDAINNTVCGLDIVNCFITLYFGGGGGLRGMKLLG